MSDTEMKEIPKKRDSQSSKSSKSSEHGAGDQKREPLETDDPEVGFIQPNHSEAKHSAGATPMEFTGLTKEDLMVFANDPFWKKVRLVLFILFWVIWAGLLVAAIIIIVFTPKCPTIPKQTFWQKAPGYVVDVSKFKDTNGDGVGDIKGVTEKLDYLSGKAGFVILQSVIAGSLGNGKVHSPAITDFKGVDSKVGTMEDLKSFLKICRQKSLKAIIQFYPHSGMNHPWFQKALKSDAKYQKYFLWSKTGSSKMVNRVGEKVWNKVQNGYFWSSLHASVPAFNLSNSALLLDLKNAVQFWLNEGFDGIFIDDAAFLAPETSTADIGAGLKVPSASGNLQKWYATGHKGQLYTAGSVAFIKEVRKWIDEVKERSDRERLFLVSAGNTGLMHDQNQTLAYLGDSKDPGAHSVVLFDLVKNLGAKFVKPSAAAALKVRLDNAMTADAKGTMYVTQTTAGPRSTDVISSLIKFLLPGTSLTIYGEEVGMTGYGDTLDKKNPNANMPYSFITNAALMDTAQYIDDVVDTYNVPMQWSVSGGFTSNKTLSTRKFPEANVMSMSALGRGTTRYNIFEEFVKLRKEPSLNWGKIDWIQTEDVKKPNYYIFSRSAEGFPKYLAVLIEPTKTKGGIARDVSSVCKNAASKLAFPSNTEFEEEGKLAMKNMYFRYHPEGSVYVFQCV